MASRTDATPNSGGAAKTQRPEIGLPVHLARLVNPDVLEQRRKKVEAAIADDITAADSRRRYLITIVEHHLWKELKSE